ncbi:MAG TPA: DUF2007 domain-containing protein [Gammaproteobacteria bacterium]|nr:DUF2007 domain-containing protein [Gammaproteobacteria bacterium]
MIPLYEAQGLLEAQMCRDYLAARGIRVHVQGVYLQGGVGQLPADTRPVLWLEDARQYRLAREMIAEVLQPARSDAPSWRCARCGEQVGPEFDICWNCGAGRTEQP